MATQLTVTVRGNPVTFTTPYDTNGQAFDALAGLVAPGGKLQDSTFGHDLIAKGKKYGLSPAQWNWVHKLAVDALTPPAPVANTPTVNLSGIVGLLNKAKTHLKNPRVTLTVDGTTVRVALAGMNSKYPGHVMVTDGSGFGGVFYGRITPDGSMMARPSLTAPVSALLTALAENPEKVAGEYGRTSGLCCFCGRPLKDERSTVVGYGPICADRFGLPWGVKTAAVELATAEMVKVEDTAADEDAEMMRTYHRFN